MIHHGCKTEAIIKSIIYLGNPEYGTWELGTNNPYLKLVIQSSIEVIEHIYTVVKNYPIRTQVPCNQCKEYDLISHIETSSFRKAE